MADAEVWLRGPAPNVPSLLQPAAHAFLQVVEDIGPLLDGIDMRDLWTTPGASASLGFHCRHLAGSTDRLLMYARGEALTPAQVAFMRAEREPGTPPEDAASLVRQVQERMELALAQIRATPEDELLSPREVGRARLPTNVLGLIFHAAEHATRHTGQIATLARVMRGSATS